MTKYLILGGCGFVGINIVHNLVSLKEVEKILVCDKSRPELSWLSPEFKKSFDDPRVVYKQINLFNEKSVSTFFEANSCDYVINAAAETRLNMLPRVYEDSIVKLGLLCAKYAVAIGAKKFIQLTSAQISCFKKMDKSDSSMYEILKCQLMLEEELMKVEGLNYTIIRPAFIYGSGDKRGLITFIIMFALSRLQNEDLRLLWTDNIPFNTVHVQDVSRACIHAVNIDESGKMFEVGDKSNSTQGSIAKLMETIYGVKYHFMGKFESLVARKYRQSIAEEVNLKYMSSWSDACSKGGLINTPLCPYIAEEQLWLNDIKVDGSLIENTGFTYNHPQIKKEGLLEVINEYVEQKLFPTSCKP